MKLLGEVAPADKESFFRQIDLFVLPLGLRNRGVSRLSKLAYGRSILVPRSGIFAEWEGTSPRRLLLRARIGGGDAGHS